LFALTITANAQNEHANKHAFDHANEHASCCKSRGSPGWNDKFHPFIAQLSVSLTNITTAKGCCISCVNNSACAEWLFYPDSDPNNISGFICDLAFNGSSTACNSITISPSNNDEEGGIIRCGDGSGSNCYPL
ncbi:2536_t:CDS:1, partial [Cetraspora pellucida]